MAIAIAARIRAANAARSGNPAASKTSSAIAAPINAVRGKDGSLTLLWRLRLAPQRALVTSAIAFLILLATGLSIRAAIVAVLCAGAAVGLFAIVRAARIPSIVKSSAAEAAARLGIRVTEPSEASA